MGESKPVDDPCATFTSVQRNAVLWFLAIIFGGGVLVFQLARIDSFMWRTNARVLDYNKYRENRLATYAVGAGDIDPRADGTLPGSAALAETAE